MAYIGKQPLVGNFVKLDAITTSATTTFNLTNGGVAYFPQSANNCLVSLNGILQAPTDSFTISGSTIVFSSALTTSDVIDFIIVLGDVLNIGTPSDATVGFAKVTSNLITGATAETSIAGGDSILIYDDSASALRKMTRTNFVSGLGGLAEVDMWRQTTNTGIGSGAVRYGLTSNWERADTYSFAKIGTGMSQSSGVFTFPSTGTYLVQFTALAYIGNDTMRAVNLDIIYSSDNGSNYNTVSNAEFNTFNSSNNTHGTTTASYIFNITNTTNEKLKFGIWEQDGKSGTVQGDTSSNSTYVIFTKLG